MQRYPKSPRLSTATASVTRHGIERIMERSTRAPSWLDQVLKDGQFARLRPQRASQKNYVLVHDVLTNSYLVPVLGRENAVVTVLTLQQYENTHGAVPAVMRQLSRAARIQGVEPPQLKGPTPAQRRAMQQTVKWRKPWFVTLRLTPSSFRKSEIRICPDVTWRQLCVNEVFQRESGGIEAVPDVKALAFPAQARLLGRSHKFAAWVARQVTLHGEELENLISVEVSWGRKPPVIDITELLLSGVASSSVPAPFHEPD